MNDRSQQFIFTVRVVVRPQSLRECQDQFETRPAFCVVADEITSNLESVPYVVSVSVNRIGNHKGESK